MPYLTNLAKVARDAGLTVVEVQGWEKRGHGVVGTVQTITCHHTANGGAKGNAPSLNVVTAGRSDLPGPLAHYVLGRDGTVYVVAAGLCYHAGASKLNRQTNSHAIGIEAEAIGVPGAAGDWPETQMVAFAKLCRALMAAFGVPLQNVEGHKETCAPAGRKTDPSFEMSRFRARIDTVNLLADRKVEDTVAFTDKHKVTQADSDAWYGAGKTGKHKVGDEVSYDELIRFPPATERLRRELSESVAAIKKLITGSK